jgi:hypothetical protein
VVAEETGEEGEGLMIFGVIKDFHFSIHFDVDSEGV